MTATLADFWPTLCPQLPAVWNSEANRQNLSSMAQHMAPIARVALECRLGDAVPQIDLQQCISREDREPELLRDFIRSTELTMGKGSGAWSRLQQFCMEWSDPTTLLHQGIAEVFLEY